MVAGLSRLYDVRGLILMSGAAEADSGTFGVFERTKHIYKRGSHSPENVEPQRDIFWPVEPFCSV